MFNWVEQKELRGVCSKNRLFGRVAEPGWMFMDFHNNFKSRMGGEDLSHIQFNPRLWNLRPMVNDSGEAMRVPVWPEAYAHVKENQQVWPKPDTNDDEQMDQDDDHMEGKGDKSDGLDL